MKEGKIAAFGTVDEIMKSDVLTDIFDTTIDVINGPFGPVAIY